MPIMPDDIYDYAYLVLKFAFACYFETQYWICEVSVRMMQRHKNGDPQHKAKRPKYFRI